MSTGLADAMVIGQAAIDGRGCELAVMDFSFMGGSMGSVVGEKFSRACDSAAERGVPLISVTGSGGARMQEGILALMQLPKTVCAVEDLRDAGQSMISVMAHPTTGGVLASFATLGDVLLAEPGALMSFAGPRVVAGDHPREAPRGLRPRRAEPPLRPCRRDRPATRAARHALQAPEAVRCLRVSTSSGCASGSAGSATCRFSAGRSSRASSTACSGSSTASASSRRDEEIWRSVELARHEDRPYTLDYVERLLDDWFELHGDRSRADDGAMIAGLGKSRRPHRGARRPAEGPRHPRAREAAVRDAESGGLPEGDPRDGARRQAPLPGRSRSSTRPAPIRASRPSSTARAERSPRRRPRWPA